MAIKDFSINIVPWDENQNALLDIRKVVFIEEQQVPEAEEIDGLDPEFTQVLLTDSEQAAIGCARISKSGKIGRVAILKEFRSTGLGVALMQFCVKHVIEQHQTPYLDAQVVAIPFYEKVGFVAEGEVFLDANIPHRRMVFALGSFISPAEPEPKDQTNTHLEPESPLQSLESPQNPEQAFEEFFHKSLRQVDITCPLAAAAWLCHAQPLQSIKGFLLGSANHRIRLLIDSKEPDLGPIAPIIALARRLPSRLLVRCVSDNDFQFEQLQAVSRSVQLAARLNRMTKTPEHAITKPLDAIKHELLTQKFLQYWEHQTWNNPYLKGLYL